LINEDNQFYATFEAIENSANACTIGTDPHTIKRFNEEVHNAVSYIWAFKRKVLGLILRCQLPGANNFPLLVDHVSREANYFRNRLTELNTGITNYQKPSNINEN
jgi:hypothetical protein